MKRTFSSGRTRVLALLASLSMMLVGLVGVVMAPAASAHTQQQSISCANGFYINLTLYNSNATNKVTITDSVDGVLQAQTTFGSSFTHTYPLSQGGASHSVTYSVVVSGDTGNNDSAYTKSYGPFTTGPCGTAPQLAGNVSVGDECALNNSDAYEYTVTWTVTNTSSVAVDVTPPGGLSPSSPQNAAASGGQVQFTKVVSSDAEIPAQSFTLSATGSSSVNVSSDAYTPHGQCPQRDFKYEKQVTITKTICADGETIEDATATGALISGTLEAPYSDKDKADFIAQIDLEAQNSAQEAFNAKYAPYEDGVCWIEPTSEVSISCSAWSADYVAGHYQVQVETDIPVRVEIDGTTYASGSLVDGEFHGSGTIDPKFQDGKTHTIVLYVNNEQVDSATSGVCAAPPPPPDCNTTGTCVTPQSFTAPGGSAEYCVAGTTPTTVEWSGATSSVSQDDANAQATANMNAAIAALGDQATAGACPVQPAVVQPAVVQPAKVPAKKPAKAVLPAQVKGGVASLPSQAVVPSSVPAGDGSSVPGTPAWAILLIVAGALGAVAAGSRMMASRK
ncbi:MAG: hypothetical protein GC156_02095 [Actinomycetales bacterium]|nr:hypothetical protein [Actinomycetales bacterium]